jgi:ABC-type multidrug transport system ATPase subunit
LRHLSKGNAQKVAIAQALLSPPGLLVLDEPWSGLDAAAHTTLRELIGEVAAAGGAVVLTDHRETVGAAVVHRLDRGVLR